MQKIHLFPHYHPALIGNDEMQFTMANVWAHPDIPMPAGHKFQSMDTQQPNLGIDTPDTSPEDGDGVSYCADVMYSVPKDLLKNGDKVKIGELLKNITPDYLFCRTTI